MNVCVCRLAAKSSFGLLITRRFVYMCESEDTLCRRGEQEQEGSNWREVVGRGGEMRGHMVE